MSSDILGAAEEELEELFPPKPGGLVDRHRQRLAKQEETTHENERIEQVSAKAVKTAAQSPEVVSTITYTIPVGGTAQILPMSSYRSRAVVRIVTATSTAILAKDNGAALGGIGYTMLTADPPFIVYSRAQLYALNPPTASAPIQISVFAELYAPER